MKRMALLILVLVVNTLLIGQQIIGTYPNMDGGFENQSGTLATASSISSAQSYWTTQIASTGVISDTGGRSGPKYVQYSQSGATHRRLQSPTDNVTAASHVIQFFYRGDLDGTIGGDIRGAVSAVGTSSPAYGSYITDPNTGVTWTKYTAVVTTTGTPAYGIGIVSTIQTGLFYIDDFVVYAGSSVDTSAPNSPGAASVTDPTATSLTINWGAASGGVDGGGYVVVRFNSDPGSGNNPNQNGIYAIGNSIPTGGTVRYIGTSTSFTDSEGLSPAATYWYKIYTVDKAFNYSDAVTASGTTSSEGGNEPTIVVDGVPLNSFGSIVIGQSSTSQSYTVSGTDLDGDIEIYAPAGFEISEDDSNWDTEIFLSPTGGEVEETTIYVRFSPSAVQAYSGNIEHSSTDASTVNVAVAGNGIKSEPTNHVTNFDATAGTNPTSEITVNWTDATGSVVPDGYLIKGSTVGYGDIANPVDGVPENNATLVRNVNAGVGTYTFQYLNSSTTHYFKIFPYTNSGASINYKTGTPVPEDSFTTSAGPELVEIILPQYIQGLNGTNNQRIPYACRLTLQNLTPNATYRYYGMFVVASDTPTTNGAGIGLFVNSDDTFTRSTTLSLGTAGQYSEFTTNGSGSYTGWFMGEPSANARFTPGNDVYYRIMLNDGNNGTALALRLTTTNTIKVINFGTQENVNQGTFLFSVSGSPAKNFAFVYDNTAGTGRPIAGTVIESDGLDLSGVTQILPQYRWDVDGVNNAWGVIIPNSVGTKGFTGIRRVESRNLSDGTLYAEATDADGVWPSGANTVNPTGGDSTPIELTGGDATLPVELSSFTATLTAQNTVSIMWVTQSETNVNGYYIHRGANSDLNASSIVSPLIAATNTSQQQYYQFTDSDVFEAGTYYYWLQVQDLDGSVAYHGPTTVYYDNGSNPGTPVIPKVTELKSVYPNPFNPSTTISYSLANAAEVSFVIYNSRGQIVRSFSEGTRDIGNHQVRWNGMDNNGRDCSTGVYYIKMNAGKDSFIRKAVLMK